MMGGGPSFFSRVTRLAAKKGWATRHSVKRRESFYTARRFKTNTASRHSHRFFPPTKGMVAACFIHDANWRSSISSTELTRLRGWICPSRSASPAVPA